MSTTPREQRDGSPCMVYTNMSLNWNLRVWGCFKPNDIENDYQTVALSEGVRAWETETRGDYQTVALSENGSVRGSASVRHTQLPDDSGDIVLHSRRARPHLHHGCQMAIAGFLGRMCLSLRASGLGLRYATLQNLIPSFPWIAPGWRVWERNTRKCCYLATLDET